MSTRNVANVNNNIRMYLSDDDGDTWSLFSTGALPRNDNLRSMQYHPPTGAIVGLSTRYQYVSTDGGVSFDEVADLGATSNP